MPPLNPEEPSLLPPPAPEPVAAKQLAPPKPAPAPTAQQPPQMRDFGDVVAARAAVYNQALQAARSIPPVQNARYKLELKDVDYEDPEDFDRQKHLNAVLLGGSLTRRLRGTWTLHDLQQNKVIAKKRAAIASLPHMTDDGLFVLQGNEYNLGNQQRMLAGAYARRRSTGESEIHLNFLPGKGLGHHYHLDPTSGVFKMEVGSAAYPLLPVLKAVGLTEQNIRGAWGDQLYEMNAKHDNPIALSRLRAKLAPVKPNQPAMEDSEAIKAALAKMAFDPEVNKRTLGHPYANLTPEAMLAATGKLLRVARGEEPSDDRDQLPYQQFLGPEDLIAERLRRVSPIMHKLLWKATTRGNIDHIPAYVFENHVTDAITNSGVGTLPEGVNPLELFDLRTRVTRMGVGGISSHDSVPDSSRDVNPTQFGFIDLVRTPECYDPLTEVMTEEGWKKWPAVTMADKFAVINPDQTLGFAHASRLIVDDYAGMLLTHFSADITYCVTPNHRMMVHGVSSPWVETFAADMDRDRRSFRTGGVALGEGLEAATAAFDELVKVKAGVLPSGSTASCRLLFMSKQEADEAAVLAFKLGKVTRLVKEEHVWALNVFDLPEVDDGSDKALWIGSTPYGTIVYAGKVYCASVPGGWMFVRRGKGLGFWCGNSGAVGVEGRMATASRKGSDGKLYGKLIDPKTGDTVWRTPQDIRDLTVAMPGEYEAAKAKGLVHRIVNGKLTKVPAQCYAMKDGELIKVPWTKVSLTYPHMEETFSPLNNFIVGKSAVKAQRASMASRFIAQALPLEVREAPLVRSAVPGTDGKVSFEEAYGPHAGAVFAAKDKGTGVVESVEPYRIVVKYSDGSKESHPLYFHHPNSRKTTSHNDPTVQAGQVVKPGQVLASSGFTDNQGHAAYGLNARVVYSSWRGIGHEDAIVVSQGFANRAKSVHAYQHKLDIADDYKTGKKDFQNIFPAAYTAQQLKKVSPDGLAVPGQVVNRGDPLVLAAAPRALDYRSVYRGKKRSFADRSLTWEHDHPGVVVHAAKGKEGVNVVVRTVSAMESGDKLSGRYGDKGLVVVLPDDDMPHDSQGRPFDVVMNPAGLPTRTNPAQILEAALGRVAEKTGKPVLLEDFRSDQIPDLMEFAYNQLAKHGLDPEEEIIDPKSGRKMKAFTGNRYLMKLHHVSASKIQGRGLGQYDVLEQPAKTGGPEGSSKRFAMMHVHAALSHGAPDVVRDIKLVKGQKNERYWAAKMAGQTPPEPEIPLAYRRYIESLRGSGVNVVRSGSKLKLKALTDADVDSMAGNREITSPETVDWEGNLAPIRGGLFDDKIGGPTGKAWGFIKLHEPILNPAFFDPARHLLGMTTKDLRNVMFGTQKIGNKTGPEAVQQALGDLDIDREIELARQTSILKKGQSRDQAVRRLKYLRACKDTGVHPKDWMISKVPVLPPIFRPVGVLPNGSTLVSDANYLYADLIRAVQAHKQLAGKVDDVSEERKMIYDSVAAVAGLEDPPNPKTAERGVRGLLQHMFGGGRAAKFGLVQRQLIGGPVDLVGRSVIVPDPDLSMDEVGVPERMAWQLYGPFIIRNLVRGGMRGQEAMRHLRDQTDQARSALVKAMDAGPVLLDRAPVLHRYGVVAQYPKLVAGNNITTSPLLYKSMGADIDGDALNINVLSSEEAMDQAARRMLPSRNLVSAADFKSMVYEPRIDYLAGLYALSSAEKASDKPPRVFSSYADVLRALMNNKLDRGDPIEVVNPDQKSIRR